MLEVVLTLYLAIAILCLVLLAISSWQLYRRAPITYGIVVILMALFWPFTMPQTSLFTGTGNGF